MKAAAELGKVLRYIFILSFALLNNINDTLLMALLQLVSMELGGKSPLIVFDDVDFDKGECHNKLLRDMVLSAFTFSRHVLDPV